MKGSSLWRDVLIVFFVWNNTWDFVYPFGCVPEGTTFIRTPSVMLPLSVYTSSDDYILLAKTDPSQCYRLCYDSEDCKAYFLDYTNHTCILTRKDHTAIRSHLKPHLAGSYHRKICLSGFRCKRHWTFDVVPGIRLVGQEDKVVPDIGSEIRCIEACSLEKSFTCRSTVYDFSSRTCTLSAYDRRLAPEIFKITSTEVDYLENQCVSEPSQCTFNQQNGRMLTHAHVYLSRSSTTRERCQESCIEHVDFRCRSFMFDNSRSLCLLTPEDSYSSPEGSTNIKETSSSETYELGSCIDVEMQCDSTSMTAILRVSTPFRGRVYALGHPYECYALTAGDKGEIAITLPLHGQRCGTKNLGNGTFINNIVVQHHPIVLKNSDRHIEVACDYDEIKTTLRSGKHVQEGEFQKLSQVVTGLAPTPSVQLRVVNGTGEDISGVELGDPLLLKVEMQDESIYGIRGSSLVARSGSESETMLLIDDRGCPVEPSVFPLLTPALGSKSLEAPFQAFRFATDSTVKFQMTVSFCLDSCPSVDCNSNDGAQDIDNKHRRSISAADTSILELQAGDVINDVITESVLFTVTSLKSASPVGQRARKFNVRSNPFTEITEKGFCLTKATVIIASVVICILQVALICFCIPYLVLTGNHVDISAAPIRLSAEHPLLAT
ncbi:uncharacterized protein LOC143257058 [Tachypleus tridentatus]|uniref:uncharacterized protein LOC143257058 n=1 Tax=Tachypleus tridentatus TaxID=6853 RepID=UPI003FD598C9